MSVTLKNKYPSGFQTLLYYKFVASRQFNTESVAQKMGISLDTLYRYIRGDRPFPIDRLPALVNATEDTEFLDFLCSQCGYCLMPRIKDKSTAKIFSHMVRMIQSALNGKENSSASDTQK